MEPMRRTTLVLGSVLLLIGAAGCASGEGDAAASGAATSGAASESATAAATSDSATRAASAPPAAPTGTSAATGVFTAAQADHGREVYTNTCANCHMAGEHSGAKFASTWNSRRVFDLYDVIYNTMPVDNPGGLSDQEYIDVVAYILQLNGHPAGKIALPADAATLKDLRIDVRGASGQ